MKKERLIAPIAMILSLGIYNAVAFTIPVAHEATFWTAYAFTAASFLPLLILSMASLNKSGTPKSRFLGLPVWLTGVLFLFLQIIVSFVCIAVPRVPVWIPIAAQSILLMFSIVFMMGTKLAKDTVIQIDQSVQEKMHFIKSIQTELECAAGQSGNAVLEEHLKWLIDTVRYSDPMSHAQLLTTENTIRSRTRLLLESIQVEEHSQAFSYIEELQQLFKTRNQTCKLLKGV